MAQNKIIIDLPRPMPASNDCLPHAAMNLGSARGVGMRPQAGMVHRLLIQEQMGNWVFYRMDDNGGYVNDSWHPTKEDALHQAKKEFGIDAEKY